MTKFLGFAALAFSLVWPLGGAPFGWGEAQAAALSQARAAADWTNLSLTLNGVAVTDISGSSSSYGCAEYVDNTCAAVTDSLPGGSAVGWGSTNALSSLPNAIGHGSTDEDSLDAYGSAKADGIVTGYARGVAFGYRFGQFGVTENASLEASLSYLFDYQFDYDPLTDVAATNYIYNLILYRLGNGSTEITRDEGLILRGSAQGDASGAAGQFGDQLSFRLDLVEPGQYAIDAFVRVDTHAQTPLAAIPEPATVALLAVGAMALAATRRRRS